MYDASDSADRYPRAAQIPGTEALRGGATFENNTVCNLPSLYPDSALFCTLLLLMSLQNETKPHFGQSPWFGNVLSL